MKTKGKTQKVRLLCVIFFIIQICVTQPGFDGRQLFVVFFIRVFLSYICSFKLEH